MMRTVTPPPRARSSRFALDGTRIARHWGRWLGLGVLAMMLGALAMLLPTGAALAVQILLGWVLVADGLVQGLHAAELRGCQGFGWKLLGATLSLAVGLLLLAFPLAGMVSLSLVIGLLLLVGGLAKCFLAIAFQALRGWLWLLGNGLCSAALGLAILLAVPEASPWALGLMLGVILILDGGWLAVTAWSAHRRAAGDSGTAPRALSPDPSPARGRGD